MLYPPLSSFVNVEKIRTLPVEDIANLWNVYHVSKAHTLSGAMTPSFHASFFSKASGNPLFVLPLPRENGFEFYLAQFVCPQVYFTPLEEYKTNGANSTPCLVLTHYTDIEGTVLMRGEATMDVEEARRLVYLIQMFYSEEKKFELVKRFNAGDAKFDYNEIVRAVDLV